MKNILKFIKRNKTPIIFAVITLGLGLVVSFLMGSFELYNNVIRPPFSPPGFLFPIFWTILYILIGLSAGMVAESNDLDKGYAIRIYFVQLFINILWPIIFFTLKAPRFALFWLVLLIIAALLTFRNFSAISKRAGALFLPYIVWLFYAFYLNFGIVVLNS
jgi:tryptophan-rich sensory protein